MMVAMVFKNAIKMPLRGWWGRKCKVIILRKDQHMQGFFKWMAAMVFKNARKMIV